MIRKYHNHKPQTTLWHREEEPLYHQGTPGSSSLFPIKMIAILERTQSNVQQNIENGIFPLTLTNALQQSVFFLFLPLF